METNSLPVSITYAAHAHTAKFSTSIQSTYIIYDNKSDNYIAGIDSMAGVDSFMKLVIYYYLVFYYLKHGSQQSSEFVSI